MRQDQFGRTLGNVSRSMRAIKRYRDSFDPTKDERRRIGLAVYRLEQAMDLLTEVNTEAQARERTSRGNG
ncbi:MAG TPA: hypothetical protein VGN72_04980 [Tepidisphaeraceae bacterium]|jgi:hypothetical protein|nr:hypothetical protein [Tepidisphaeraceae bacterium]